MQFIDPRTDFAFKKIFGNDKATDILISFLNAVLGLDEEHKIIDVIIMNPYQAPKIKYAKYTYLDVKCKDNKGVEYVVEMQVLYVLGFEKRVFYNASKAYVNQLEEGEDYPKLNQVIAISILDFILFDDFEHYLSCHKLKETITNNIYLDEIRYYFIELPKFNKKENKLENNLEKWVFFLKNAGRLDYIPKSLSVGEFKQAFDIASRSQLSKVEWESYDESSVHLQDEKGAIEAALLTGKEIGIEEGIKKGKEIGIEEGKEIGIKEKALKIAKTMLENDMDIKTISLLTELSEKEIISLKNK